MYLHKREHPWSDLASSTFVIPWGFVIPSGFYGLNHTDLPRPRLRLRAETHPGSSPPLTASCSQSIVALKAT